MRQLTETQRLGLLDAVRMFALANMANIDATVAVWHAKRYYDFWRPFHAVGLADTDGNPRAEPEPNWVSEHIVPPVQEYPSAHALFPLAWISLGISLAAGLRLQRGYTAFLLRPANEIAIDEGLGILNTSLATQIDAFYWALGFLGAWLVIYLMVRVFGETA